MNMEFSLGIVWSIPCRKLEGINSFTLNERRFERAFWETYLRPSMDNFQSKLKALSPLEKKYFYAIYNFITKELYTSIRDVDYEGRTRSRFLCGFPTGECQGGEILYDLRIKGESMQPISSQGLGLSLRREKVGGGGRLFLPNFASGDTILL